MDGGAGHALVLLYIGGNDLAAYIFTSDAEAQSAFTRIKPQILADLDRTFAYFRDTTRFPDGVTFLLSISMSVCVITRRQAELPCACTFTRLSIAARHFLQVPCSSSSACTSAAS